MPLENSVTQGTKGNNSNYQRGVTELLKQISSAVGGGGSANYLTASVTRATGAGSTNAGTKSVSFYNAGGANGTVQGAVIKPSEIFTWETDSGLNPISYDGTNTELVITTAI